MSYVITGATSGTGDAVVRLLINKVGANNITCLVRPTSDTRLLESYGLHLHVCDVTEPDSLLPALSPETVYLDMSKARYYHQSLAALQKAGVKRAYFVTTTAVYSHFNDFSRLYQENEDKIRNSGITYTILRPTMIYGSLRDHNMHRLIKTLSRCPIFPLFDNGRGIMQPVYVGDVAAGIVSAIDNSKTENREYNLAGPSPITYGEIVNCILNRLGRGVRTINVNTSLASAIVSIAQHIPGFPITQEQVLRLREDKSCDISAAAADLDYSPRGFDEGIELELAEMRAADVIRQLVNDVNTKQHCKDFTGS